MTSREVTLKELWQTCRVCEDSCRRMADVFVELMRQAEGAPPLRPVTVEAGLWGVCWGPEPEPHCWPPGPCGSSLSALADKAQLLARRVSVLVEVSRSLRDQNPPREIFYYTCVPEGLNTPLP